MSEDLKSIDHAVQLYMDASIGNILFTKVLCFSFPECFTVYAVSTSGNLFIWSNENNLEMVLDRVSLTAMCITNLGAFLNLFCGRVPNLSK